MSPRQ